MVRQIHDDNIVSDQQQAIWDLEDAGPSASTEVLAALLRLLPDGPEKDAVKEVLAER